MFNISYLTPLSAAMTTALLLRWVLLILIPARTHQTLTGTFSLKFQSTVSGLLGSSVSLDCAIIENKDARPLKVHWYRPTQRNTPVLLYHNSQIQKSSVDVQYQDRVFLSGDLEKGEVSLKLENLTLTDRGDYVCEVTSEDWYDKATISLSVRVVGSAPIVSLKEAGGGQMNISCQSHGWLPEPSVTWRDKEGRYLKPLSKDTFTNNSEGLVDVNSWLMVSPSESEWISCSVALSDQERTESRIMLDVPQAAKGSWNGVVIVFTLLLLLLLLCVAGIAVYCVFRKKGVIICKRKGREDTGGTAEENEPLNRISVENQDQTGDPSVRTSHSVVVEMDPNSEQRTKLSPASAPESREESRTSTTISTPVFSTADSHTTDKQNLKPAATMSEIEPSPFTSNTTPVTTSNTTPVTISNTTAVTTSNTTPLTTSNTTPLTTTSMTISSNPPAAVTFSDPTSNSFPAPTPTTSTSTPTPTTSTSTPTPTTSTSTPIPTTSTSTPTPTTSTSTPTPITSTSTPTPTTSTSTPTHTTSTSTPTPTTSTSTPTPTTSTSTPTPTTSTSTPTPTTSTSTPTPTTSTSTPIPTTSTSTPIPTTSTSTPPPTTSTSTPTPTTSTSTPIPTTSTSTPTPTTSTSTPTPTTSTSTPTPTTSTSTPTPTTSTSTTSPTYSIPTSETTMSEHKHTGTTSESATVSTTSEGHFSSVSKQPRIGAERTIIKQKGRKRKDMVNETGSSSGKAEEINQKKRKRKAEQPAPSSSTASRCETKRLCIPEVSDDEGESSTMAVDVPTASVPEEMDVLDSYVPDEMEMMDQE